MLARAALLRITGVAVGSVARVADELTVGAALVAVFVSSTGFPATLVRSELFVTFLFLFTIFVPSMKLTNHTLVEREVQG